MREWKPQESGEKNAGNRRPLIHHLRYGPTVPSDVPNRDQIIKNVRKTARPTWPAARFSNSTKASPSVKSEPPPSNVQMPRINLADVAGVAKQLGVSEPALLEAARRWVAPIDERL